MALVPRARRHYAPIALILATVSVALAQGSGEQLEERVTKTELVKDSANEGERVLGWAIGSTLATAVPRQPGAMWSPVPVTVTATDRSGTTAPSSAVRTPLHAHRLPPLQGHPR